MGRIHVFTHTFTMGKQRASSFSASLPYLWHVYRCAIQLLTRSIGLVERKYASEKLPLSLSNLS